MTYFPWLCFLTALCAVTWANPGGAYDWYDVNQVASVAVGGGGGDGGSHPGSGGGGAAASTSSHPSASLYSAAAPAASTLAKAPTAGHTDSLVSELLSHTSDDDGLTLDLFNNLAQFTAQDTGKGSSSSSSTAGPQQDDLLAKILAQVASAGSTTGDLNLGVQPAGDTPSVGQLQAASNVFNIAQGFSRDADLALAKAKSQLSLGGEDSLAEAANSAKAAALVTVASAKAEARSSVVQSRNAYVASLGKLRDKVTVMKMIEKRFRALAVAFSKVRDYAGQALLSLKSMTAKKGDYSSNSAGGHGYTLSKDDILTTVASAKARIAKMKIVEKRFLALAQSLAKIRAQTYAEVRDVRKNAISFAKITTAAQAQVNAAADTASNIVSQAVATARATAMAKAEAAATAAIAAKSKAETIINAAAGLVAGAKADVAVDVAAPAASISSGAGADYGVVYSAAQKGTSYGDATA